MNNFDESKIEDVTSVEVTPTKPEYKRNFCKYCGKELQPDDAFCSSCGKSQVKSTVQQPIVDEVSSDSQQEFDDEQEETMKLWKKILYFLVGPIGILAGLVYYFNKKTSMAKSAFLCGIIGTVLWFAVPKIYNYNEPEHTAKLILINEFLNKKGVFLVIKDFSLLHKAGNEYIGIVKCNINDQATQFDVNVVYDGSDVLVQWEWPDVCRGDTHQEESY